MAYSTDRARYESELARAHRAIFNARNTALDMNDISAEQDLDQLLREVTRLAQDSLRPHKRPYRGQMRLV